VWRHRGKNTIQFLLSAGMLQCEVKCGSKKMKTEKKKDKTAKGRRLSTIQSNIGHGNKR
jgi:hypothetical protein